MPGMNGYEVCEAIKADPLICNAAIIFVTSHDKNLHELQALNLGGVDFIQKPLNIPIARARVKTHLALQIRTRELIQARRDLSDVMENLPAFIAHWNTKLTNAFSNDIAGQWFGLTAEAMREQQLDTVLGATNFALMQSHLKIVLSGQNSSFDMTFVRSGHPPIFGQVSLVYRHNEESGDGFLMLITDITARKLAEMALFNEMERLRITLNSIGDAVISTDENGMVDFVNPIAETLTGWYSSEAIGQPIENIMPLREGTLDYVLQNPIRLALKEQRTVGMAMNCVLRRRDGKDFEVEDSAAPIRDQNGTITGAIIVFHDVSEARAMAIKMTHLANHDALTNLPNRMLLQDRTEQALQKAQRSGERVAMLLLDIDHFKLINDSLGHSVGDKLLQVVATRLKQTLRSTDTVGRFGGDEFIFILEELADDHNAFAIAECIEQAISQTINIVGLEHFTVAASIGIAVYPKNGDTAEKLMSNADRAMYRAKKSAVNQIIQCE